MKYTAPDVFTTNQAKLLAPSTKDLATPYGYSEGLRKVSRGGRRQAEVVDAGRGVGGWGVGGERERGRQIDRNTHTENEKERGGELSLIHISEPTRR